MAEEESKKEEEKLEFTAEGEAIGYISLDQARVLALRHACDNTDFYGRRNANCDLAWDVLDEEEREDYYYIRRSYPPARGFRGEPGVELFTIDKAGPIEFRQILAEPQAESRLKLVLVLVGVAVAASGIIGGLAGAGVFSPESENQFGQFVVTVLPDQPARVKSANGEIVVDVAPGTVRTPSRLEIRSLGPVEIPALPAAFKATDKAFDLTIDGPLLKPITVLVQVSDAEVTLAGGDEANIVIQRFRDGAWRP